MQSGVVAAHVHRIVGHLGHPVMRRRGHGRVVDGIGHEFGEVDFVGVQILAFVEPGQQQQVGHQRVHPLRFSLDAGQEYSVISGSTELSWRVSSA